MPFRIGLSGLNAAAADLEVTGNNIANTGTVGFKESRAEFADVFAQAYGGISKTAIGSGVRLAATTQQFSQGNLEYTENSLDLGINGEGFFVLEDADGISYTRAGAYQVDRNGYVVNSEGQRLQVYPPITEGTTETMFDNGNLSDLQLEFGDNPPQATTDISTTLNLRSDAVYIPDPEDTGDPPAMVEFDHTDPSTYNYSSSITVYDSLGTPRTMTLYFQKTETELEWNVYAELDGWNGDSPNTLEGQTVLFDSNGQLAPGQADVLDFDFDLTAGEYDPVNGATIGPLDDSGEATGIMSVDIGGMTQYGTSYSVSELSQNGFTTGKLTGYDVDQTGVVFARYSNGQAAALGQVVLANFANPQGLQQLGDNTWAETYAAGDPLYGAPGSSNLGLIQSGALEASNVDIAEQLVNLITAQRNYQANAQTISTADEVTQTIINIR